MKNFPKIEKPQISQPEMPEQAKKLHAEKKMRESLEAEKNAEELEKIAIEAEEDIRREANNDYNRLYDFPANPEGEPVMQDGEFVGEKGEKVKLECFGYTLGDHKINQDAGFFNAEKGIIGVCDGAGGHAGGEVASRKTAEIINQEVAGLKYKKFANEDEFTQAKMEFKQALEKVQKRTKKEVKKGISTASFVKVLGELEGTKKLAVSWSGDSSAYIRRADGKIEKITEEHNRLEELRRGERKSSDLASRAVMDFPEGRIDEIGGLKVLEKMIDQVAKCETAFDLKKVDVNEIYKGIDAKDIKDKIKIRDLLKTLRYLQKGISRCQGKGCDSDFDTKYVDLNEGDWVFVVSDAIGDNVPQRTLEKALTGDVNDFNKLGQGVAGRIKRKQKGIKVDDLTIEAMQLAA